MTTPPLTSVAFRGNGQAVETRMIGPPTATPSVHANDTGQHLRIGIVIPCRGDQAFLSGCLASLKDFSSAGDVVIVVDGDADQAVARLARSGGAVYLSRPNSRRGHAIGCGIQWILHRAAADILLLCHADMVLPAGSRTRLLDKLGAQARCRWGLLGHHINDRRLRFRLLELGNHWRGVALSLPYGDQAMFVGVDLLARAGGWPFQPELEDLELSLRLRQWMAATFVNAPVAIGTRHWTKGICRTTIRNWMLAARYTLSRQELR